MNHLEKFKEKALENYSYSSYIKPATRKAIETDLQDSFFRRFKLAFTVDYLLIDTETGEKITTFTAYPRKLKKAVKLWRIEENKRRKSLIADGYNYNLVPENIKAIAKPYSWEAEYLLSLTRYKVQTIKATDKTTYTEPPRINYFED